jgi:hypothetical protein
MTMYVLEIVYITCCFTLLCILVDDLEHGGASDTLFDRTVTAKKSKYASQPCSSDASENSNDEEARDAWHQWNTKTKKFKC